MKLLFKNKFWVILLCCLFFSPNSFSAIHYDCTIITNSVPPVERNKKKTKTKIRKKNRLKKESYSINSPRIGKVYLILGIIFLSITVLSFLGLIFLPKFFIVFLVGACIFLIVGIFCFIWGLFFVERNKDWDIDYR